MATTPVEGDLNQIILAGVNARIEAQVAQALNGDEGFQSLVVAALQQTVEVSDGSGYSKKRVPFLSHLIAQSLREATKAAVQRYLTDHIAELEDAIQVQLEQATPEIARQMVAQLGKKAAENYGLQVSVRYPGSD